MALASTIRFGQVAVLIEGQDTSGGTGIYEGVCGVEQLTMTVNLEQNTTNIPDCDDPDLPSWLETDLVSQQMTIEGEGVLDTEAMQVWQDWYFNHADENRNVRFFRDLSAPNGGGYFQGPAKITAYSETGQRGERWRNSFTITFQGKPTFTPATP